MIATSDFLIPNATIIAELIAFLLVLGFLVKWVLPPVNKVMGERQAKIAQSLEVVDEAKAMMAEAKSSYEAATTKAHEEGRAIIDQASRLAEEIHAEARGRSQADYERRMAQAVADIESARRAAVQELEAQIGLLVVSIASRVVEAELDPERHRALIDRAIAAVDPGALSGIQAWA